MVADACHTPGPGPLGARLLKKSGPDGELTPRTIWLLCLVNLVDALNFTVIVPYVDAMICWLLHKPRGDPSTTQWVALVVAAYGAAEVVFSAPWGRLADRVGRRPVLLVGLAGSALAALALGLSGGVWQALAARLLDGAFCGNLGVLRTYLGEVTRGLEEGAQAAAFGNLEVVFAAAMLAGPLVGGLLCEPAERWPGVFGDTVFERYPYLLPNLVLPGLASAVFVVGISELKETELFLQQREQEERGVPNGQGSMLAHRGPDSHSGPSSDSYLLVIDVWRAKRTVVLLVAASSLLTGYAMARLQAFLLITALPSKMDGMDYNPASYSAIQSVAAVALLWTGSRLYPGLAKHLPPQRIFALGVVSNALLMLPFPLYCRYGWRPTDPVLLRYGPLTTWQALSAVGFGVAFPSIDVLIDRACDAANRGTAFGAAASANAASKCLFTMLAGWLVRVGCGLEEDDSAPEARYLVFYVNILAGLGSVAIVSSHVPSLEAIST